MGLDPKEFGSFIPPGWSPRSRAVKRQLVEEKRLTKNGDQIRNSPGRGFRCIARPYLWVTVYLSGSPHVSGKRPFKSEVR